jgi:hypothetical protein
MEGFDYKRAHSELKIPDGFKVEAMAAIGLPANPEVLPAEQKKREGPSDRRKLEETICEGPFCF